MVYALQPGFFLEPPWSSTAIDRWQRREGQLAAAAHSAQRAGTVRQCRHACIALSLAAHSSSCRARISEPFRSAQLSGSRPLRDASHTQPRTMSCPFGGGSSAAPGPRPLQEVRWLAGVRRGRCPAGASACAATRRSDSSRVVCARALLLALVHSCLQLKFTPSPSCRPTATMRRPPPSRCRRGAPVCGCCMSRRAPGAAATLSRFPSPPCHSIHKSAPPNRFLFPYSPAHAVCPSAAAEGGVGVAHHRAAGAGAVLRRGWAAGAAGSHGGGGGLVAPPPLPGEKGSTAAGAVSGGLAPLLQLHRARALPCPARPTPLPLPCAAGPSPCRLPRRGAGPAAFGRVCGRWAHLRGQAAAHRAGGR